MPDDEAIGNLVMPQTQAQGDIPLTAISTGSVDSLECVLLKMGIDQSEFTTPANGGRVHMYEGNGASLTGGTPAETTLMANGGSYMNYDQILFPCWGVDPTPNGSSNVKTAAELGNLVTYANAGGHFFATHYSFAWEYQNAPFNTVVKWHVDADSANGPDPFSVQAAARQSEGHHLHQLAASRGRDARRRRRCRSRIRATTWTRSPRSRSTGSTERSPATRRA